MPRETYLIRCPIMEACFFVQVQSFCQSLLKYKSRILEVHPRQCLSRYRILDLESSSQLDKIQDPCSCIWSLDRGSYTKLAVFRNCVEHVCDEFVNCYNVFATCLQSGAVVGEPVHTFAALVHSLKNFGDCLANDRWFALVNCWCSFRIC